MKQVAQNYKTGELNVLDVPLRRAGPAACWCGRCTRSSPPAPRS